ncbi:rhomboid family intramembrane serine protease [Spirochaetia bacterium 38H-sp]|uniref:Rhomboid family intramembrane serine protease n=1 Tax=Rarispira pelagica TaxID=3141764 RepID=A0ABU9UCX3_9SPIR
MKIKYNAPVTLTFALISTAVLVLDIYAGTNLTERLFSVPGKYGFVPGNFIDWIRLLTHVMGHASWSHLLGNFAFILLLGPILEEKYSSLSILGMIVVTALVTGLVNVIFSSYGLYGASGVVFMMILLASFSNMKGREIPITFILVTMIYLGREISSAFDNNNISEMAHLVGGACGAVFGFGKRKG